MANPLSAYGVRDSDYAMAVGMAMGEAMHEGLVGMGLVAATALNRAQSPGTYMARSRAMGDVFAAPFSAETMIDATRRGRSLPSAGRQFSPTFNKDIRGASTAGHQNFKTGLEAALAASINPDIAPSLGIRQDGFMRAQKAVEVAVKARDIGIDIGLGVEHFSAPGFERQAQVGKNRSRFGGHSLSPTGGWPAGVKAPTSKEFASRFAAAAALTGVSIPDAMVKDITTHVNRADIMAAASIVQRQAQDSMSKELERDVMPGMTYSDLVQKTGLEAIDVPDVTGRLGISPAGALGFAENFGITLDNDYEAVSRPDPIGAVEFGGYLDPVGPSPIDGPNAFTGTGSLAPAGAFSNQALGPSQGFTSPEAASLFSGTALGSPQSFDTGWTPGLEGFNAPGLIDQASFEDRFSAGFPDPARMDADTFNAIQEAAFQQPSISMGYPETEIGITSPGALGMGQAFGIEADPFSPSGFAAGVDAGPWGNVPDASAPSLEARNAMDRFEGAMSVRNNPSFDVSNEAIADRVMAELTPKTAAPAPTASAPVSPSLESLGLSPVGTGWFDAAFSATPDLGTLSALPSMARMDVPQAPIAPAPVSQVAAAPSVPMGDIALPGTVASVPQAPVQAAPVQAAPSVSLPAAPAPSTTRTQAEVAKDYDLPSFDLPDLGLPSIDISPRGIGSALGMVDPVDRGFMDAMANVQAANAYQSGFFDTRMGKATTGAFTGALTGGIPGAVMGGLWGGLGIGDMFGNAFDGFANAYANLTPDDFAAFMADGNPYDREPTGNTGMTGGFDGMGGGRLGDGSYSDSSGRNPNSPQGLL
jgi:hypothetical protein